MEYLSCDHEHLTCGVVCDRSARGEAPTTTSGNNKPQDKPPESQERSKWAQMAAEIKSKKQPEEPQEATTEEKLSQARQQQKQRNTENAQAAAPVGIIDSSAIAASEASWMEANKDSRTQSRRLLRGASSGRR